MTYHWTPTGFVNDRSEVRTAEDYYGGTATPERPPVEPLSVVLRFYRLLDEHRYRDAYNLLSARSQAQFPFESWREGFRNTKSIYVSAVRPNQERPGEVLVSFTAYEAKPDGGEAQSLYSGSWNVTLENGRWLLADPVIDSMGDLHTRSLTYLAGDSGRELRLRRGDGTGNRVLASGVLDYSWTPDGQFIVYLALTETANVFELRRVSPDGSESGTLASGASGFELA
jgi:hypothetical protein